MDPEENVTETIQRLRTLADSPRERDESSGDDDEHILILEEMVVEQTDNGWQLGDPLDQPDNPEPWSSE